MDRSVTCAFTGHRPAALPWGDNEADPRCVALKARLAEAVERAYERGYRHFVCGMAQGADCYFCETALELRRRKPDVTVEAAVPFPGQCDGWAPRDKRRYRRLVSQCDLETMVQREYSATCMQRRNKYMVDHASLVIAVFNGDPSGGGTLNTLSYALAQGVETDILEIDGN